LLESLQRAANEECFADVLCTPDARQNGSISWKLKIKFTFTLVFCTKKFSALKNLHRKNAKNHQFFLALFVPVRLKHEFRLVHNRPIRGCLKMS
jgi:hypothetical protein